MKVKTIWDIFDLVDDKYRVFCDKKQNIYIIHMCDEIPLDVTMDNIYKGNVEKTAKEINSLAEKKVTELDKDFEARIQSRTESPDM